jgi:hypothetical protein
MPPVTHFIYIPSVLMIGVVIGVVFGGRAARDAEAARLRAEEAKAARRAARAAAARPEDKSPGT